MRFNLKSFFLLFFFVSALNADNYVDTLSLIKIKKLVQKEEEIAIAYKKYILEKGENPTTISSLLIDNYLPKGFSTINPFGKMINLIEDNKIESSLPEDMNLKSNLYDYYYSNKYRTYTKAPLKIKKDNNDNNDEVEILLSSKEKFIYSNKSKITTTKEDAKDKYFLDSKGVLHWYDASGKYKFSFDNELLLDEGVTLLNDDGTVNNDYKNLVNDVFFVGMTVFHKNATSNTADEYIMIDLSNAVKVKQTTRDIGKTIIQFTRRAGGMIINGDIYTWGNIANRIVGIDKNKYTKSNGSNGSYYPVITGLVRARVKTYDAALDNQNYFSSPLRPKFIDFFSTVFHSTCGISIDGSLYCGGLASAYQSGFLYTNIEPSNSNVEMLYKSKDFDGTVGKKATKIFANDAFWLIFGNTDIDNNGNYKNGKIYRWGGTNYGFGGNGNRSFSTSKIGELVVSEGNTKVLFKDLTYLLSLGHRKIAALSNQGDIYIWGVDSYNSNSFSCNIIWENKSYNLCIPTKITLNNSTMDSSIKFESIQGGLDAFIAKDEEGKYYKISHPINKKIQVKLVDNIIGEYSDVYDEEDDTEILSIDFSRKITEIGSSSIASNGIVWINSKNELKGDYYTDENRDDLVFKDSIKKIKWKKIRVIQDDNGMCGIDVNNQMYCWGMMSFYGQDMRDTFMLPVFNTNLYDSDKDFLVAEGGNSNLTNMTSDEWTTSDSRKSFFIKYPTYIGGFNYEFIFK